MICFPLQAPAAPLPTVLPAAKRLIAIGDLHGDYAKTLRALKLAGLVDDDLKWSGGDSVVVQVRWTRDEHERQMDGLAVVASASALFDRLACPCHLKPNSMLAAARHSPSRSHHTDDGMQCMPFGLLCCGA